MDHRLVLQATRTPTRFDAGWLRTGDVGMVYPDGYLTLTDRAKDVIKSGGEWISSVDLENHLMAHPDVIEAAVVGVPDPRWQERPLASVVLREDASVSPTSYASSWPHGCRVAAAGAVGLHRRGAQDVGRQVLQEDPAPDVRRRRLGGRAARGLAVAVRGARCAQALVCSSALALSQSVNRAYRALRNSRPRCTTRPRDRPPHPGGSRTGTPGA